LRLRKGFANGGAVGVLFSCVLGDGRRNSGWIDHVALLRECSGWCSDQRRECKYDEFSDGRHRQSSC
jgi:hypothetical protein